MDIINGFKYKNVHKFEKVNSLSKNKFELSFYQDQKTWKHELIPIEFNENDSDTDFDLLIYKIRYVFIRKLIVFLGIVKCKFVCRCLKSSTCENMIIKPKEKC